MLLKALCVGQMQVNCYILASEEGSAAIIIDPGDDCSKIKEALAKYKLRPGLIINTHGHIDHIGCDDEFGIDIYAHSKEVPLLKDPRLNLSGSLTCAFSVKAKINPLEDRESIILEKIELEIIHLPGHTPGGIALLLKKPKNKILFTGDSLFYRGIGRTDFPGSDEELLIKSIKERLFSLSKDTVIYPGHGPSSTIGEEKKNNPFLA